MIEPILPPVIMNIAITRVYRVMAVWMPVTVVPTSLATVAIDTFMTELSRVIRNCPAAKVSRTSPVLFVAVPAGTSAAMVTPLSPQREPPGADKPRPGVPIGRTSQTIDAPRGASHHLLRVN